MIRRLTTEGGIQGVHFCTLNLEKSVQRILEHLKWTGVAAPVHNKLIAVGLLTFKVIVLTLIMTYQETPGATIHPPPRTDSSDLMVSPSTATTSATFGLAQMPATEGEAGRGELNNAATWDDFPNGRFGDFKSPAFGNQDPWGNPTIGVSWRQTSMFVAGLTTSFPAPERSIGTMGPSQITGRPDANILGPPPF